MSRPECKKKVQMKLPKIEAPRLIMFQILVRFSHRYFHAESCQYRKKRAEGAVTVKRRGSPSPLLEGSQAALTPTRLSNSTGHNKLKPTNPS